MEHVKVRLPNGRCSWTIIDERGTVIETLQNWIIHLEETNTSPNTIKAYIRHMVRLGNFLEAKNKYFKDITVTDFDYFLRWAPWIKTNSLILGSNIVALSSESPPKLTPSIKNQIINASKCLFQYLSANPDLGFMKSSKNKFYEGTSAYKPFLEHINQRKYVRQKEKYLSGDLALVQKKITDKRLDPENILNLIQNCTMLRDAFLVALLYNTGIRIGEALGLRHTDINLKDKIVWIVPRDDNENGARAKSKRTRGIPVHEYLINMYEDYLTSEEYSEAFENGSIYIFCNLKQGRVGRALSFNYINKLKTYLRRRSKIYFSWHMFRHTHASETIAAGYSLLEVADRLGHVSPQTTVDFYRHLFSSEVRKLYLNGPNKIQKRLEEMREAQLLGRNLTWL